MTEIRSGPPVPITRVEGIALDPVQQGVDGIEQAFAFVGLGDLVGGVAICAGLEAAVADQVESALEGRLFRLACRRSPVVVEGKD